MAERLGGKVRNLTGEHVAALTDGEIFRTISTGNGEMLGLRGLIAPEERWLIVLEVRAKRAAALAAADSAAAPLPESDVAPPPGSDLNR
jgi:hypothetical protein